MRFGILGPLEVVEDEPVALGHGRHRALLALLLLHANDMVSVDRLVDDLWGESPPATAQKILQNWVAQLRRALGTERARIETGAIGYRIVVEPGELDADRFMVLLARGRRELADGDARSAAATLRDALAIWRGRGLSDFADEWWAGGAIADLEEHRIAALEERIAADLSLGSAAELVAELTGLAREHPTRERLHGQLMVALYRSHRQADALAVYSGLRERLDEELGLQPSDGLRQLERAVLTQTLDEPRTTFAGPAPASPAGGSAPASVGGQGTAPETGNERKLVTVLFGDLVGSTAFAADLDAERARSLLERFYAGMASEVAAAGGTVEKFIGDAVVAVFGAPFAQEDHAERALLTALAMRGRMASLFGDKMDIRIGVNTGEVFVAGARAGGSYATGDAVNVAARLEQAAEPGEVLVGERTVLAVGGAFEFAEPTVAEGKGKPGGIPCRRLVRAVSARRPRRVETPSGVFLGRDRELGELKAAYERTATEGCPILLTIVGVPGIGKTTLVGELFRFLDDLSPPPQRLTGRCLSYGVGITYWALGEVLKERFGILDSDPPETVRARLAGRSELAWTLGVDPPEGVHPLAARDQLHQAWAGFLTELVSQRPLVLLIEDAHWGADSLLELLETLVFDVRGPLLVLVTGRPELLERRWIGNAAHRGASTLELSPVSAADARSLISLLLRSELPADLAELVLVAAEGNPLFVEELLAGLADQGILVPDDGGWIVGEVPTDLTLPDSIQAVIAARIDLLPAAEKSALQAASVIGRNFWSGPVYELLKGDEPDLRLLEERQLIGRVSGTSIAGEREFSFRHALTRQVAYGSLPKAERAKMHAAFAEWLEASGERDDHAPLLAHHYAEAARADDADLAWSREEERLARLRTRAVIWLRRAADVAIGRYAIGEGLALLERALDFTPPGEIAGEVWRAIGRAHALRYEGEATVAAYEHAAALIEAPEQRAEVYSELALETVNRYGMLNPMPTREVVDGWIDTALELANPQSGARAKALIARALWYQQSDEAAAEAVAIAGELREADVDLRSHAYNARVLSSFAAGRYAESIEWADKRLQLAERITDPDHLVDIYSMPIPGLLGLGRFHEARRFAEMHAQAAQRLSTHHQVHAVAMKLELEELTGDWSTIRELGSRTEEVVEANQATPCVRNARSLLSCALAGAYAGEHVESERLEERSNDLDMAGFAPMLAPLRLRLALLRNREVDIERLLADAIPPPLAKNWWRLTTLAARLDALAALDDRRRVEQEAPPLVVPHTYLEPFALRALGVVRQDHDLITRATASFHALGLEWYAGQVPTRIT